jgi:ADP-ribosylglycohydrolase
MRTPPLALPFLGTPGKVAFEARQVSDLTHFDPMAGDATVLWSCAIERAVTHDTFDVHAGIYAGIEYLPAESQIMWHTLIHQALTGPPPRHNLNVVKAFQAALWAVGNHDSYESIIQAAIEIGGDTDTVAAIAGGLAGAMYGASAVPAGWVKVLHGWPGLVAADLEAMALDAAGVKS